MSLQNIIQLANPTITSPETGTYALAPPRFRSTKRYAPGADPFASPSPRLRFSNEKSPYMVPYHRRVRSKVASTFTKKIKSVKPPMFFLRLGTPETPTRPRLRSQPEIRNHGLDQGLVPEPKSRIRLTKACWMKYCSSAQEGDPKPKSRIKLSAACRLKYCSWFANHQWRVKVKGDYIYCWNQPLMSLNVWQSFILMDLGHSPDHAPVYGPLYLSTLSFL